MNDVIEEVSRRRFLAAAGGLALATALPRPLRADQTGKNMMGSGWRQFEIITQIEILKQEGVTRVWLPLPSIEQSEWIRPLDNRWQGNADVVRVEREPVWGAAMLYAQWPANESAPQLELTNRVATRDRAVDLATPRKGMVLERAQRLRYTRPTKLLPIDGIVRQTALEITRGAKTDVDKARRIYDWICENTFRDPKVAGCGTGDITAMLVTGNLSGKCADLNALYVGLARAAGLPARDVYGIRVADSRQGFRSLGKSGDLSKAQHCRAEVWLAGFGWLPVDPADVRKVVLEEKPGLSLQDDIVVAARHKLFGGWEMNWIGYNFAHDVVLPHSSGPQLPFLMYPQAETARGRLDSLDPERFRYRITAKDIADA